VAAAERAGVQHHLHRWDPPASPPMSLLPPAGPAPAEPLGAGPAAARAPANAAAAPAPPAPTLLDLAPLLDFIRAQPQGARKADIFDAGLSSEAAWAATRAALLQAGVQTEGKANGMRYRIST
jgi:hypothetical protein